MLQVLKLLVIIFSICIINYNNNSYEPSYYVNFTSYIIIIYLIVDLFITYLQVMDTNYDYKGNYTNKSNEYYNYENNYTYINTYKPLNNEKSLKKVKKLLIFKHNIQEFLEKTNENTKPQIKNEVTKPQIKYDIQKIYKIILKEINQTTYDSYFLQSRILFIYFEKDELKIIVTKDFPLEVILKLTPVLNNELHCRITFEMKNTFSDFIKSQKK